MSDNRFECGGCGQWLWVWDKSSSDHEESNSVILDHPIPGEMNIGIDNNGAGVPKVYCRNCDQRMVIMD